MVETIMQGVVEAIKTEQRLFGLNNYPAASGLKCKCIVWQEPFKGTDEKIICGVIPVFLQILCKVKTQMCKRAQSIA